MPLMSAGLDSLGAVELRNGVSARFGMSLPATVAFDFSTLKVPLCSVQQMHRAAKAKQIYSYPEKCCLITEHLPQTLSRAEKLLMRARLWRNTWLPVPHPRDCQCL